MQFRMHGNLFKSVITDAGEIHRDQLDPDTILWVEVDLGENAELAQVRLDESVPPTVTVVGLSGHLLTGQEIALALEAPGIYHAPAAILATMAMEDGNGTAAELARNLMTHAVAA